MLRVKLEPEVWTIENELEVRPVLALESPYMDWSKVMSTYSFWFWTEVPENPGGFKSLKVILSVPVYVFPEVSEPETIAYPIPSKDSSTTHL